MMQELKLLEELMSLVEDAAQAPQESPADVIEQEIRELDTLGRIMPVWACAACGQQVEAERLIDLPLDLVLGYAANPCGNHCKAMYLPVTEYAITQTADGEFIVRDDTELVDD